MRNKTRFDYIDEFRKINTLQKLLPMQSLFIDDQDDGKQQNNKFIRYKDEWVIEENMKEEEVFIRNPIIASYNQDLEAESLQQFGHKINTISNDIDYFQNWSQVLNNDIKTRDYKHKFKYLQKVAPPPRIKEEPDSNNAVQIGDDRPEDKAKQSKEDTNIELPKRGKYNFNEITDHINSKQYTKGGKQNDTMRDLSIKSEILQLRKLKNLAQIQKIGDFYSEFSKFNYYIEPKPDLCDIDFVDNSIILGSNNLSFDYFRDIGMPSRNILQYTTRNAKKLKTKGEDDSMDLLQAYSDQKRELIYLYFLKDEQLKINKNEMTFYDMANISTGRITSGNAHMCIRSEKVTLQQYDKLLRKMEKYDLRENQTGQPKIDTGVGDEDTDDLNFAAKGEQEQQRDDDNLNIEKIIEQINNIRKEVKSFEQPNTTNLFHPNNFNDQVYIKLERLLNNLFDIVVEKMPVKYSIDQIRDHIHEIDGKSEAGYDRLRVLWFIVNVYDEMMKKQQKTVNLRGIAFQKANAVPLIVKYKGKKSMKETIQPKKVYGFDYKKATKDTGKTNQTDKTPNKNKSAIWRSTLNKTPVKGDTNVFSRTPRKGEGSTNQKLNSSKWITSEKKPPQTAHK